MLATNDKCKTIGDKLGAFCDKSRHTASSENYFIDSTTPCAMCAYSTRAPDSSRV